MPETAAQELAEAQRRLLDASLPPEAHEQAAEAYVRAHRHFLDRIGVESRTQVQVGNAIGAILIAVIVLSMAFNISYSATAKSTAGSASHTANEVSEIQSFLTAAIRAGCERGNERSVSDIRNLRADRHKLREERRFLGEVIPGRDPPLNRYLHAVEHDIRVKTRTIKEQLRSVAPVAIKPRSARANCKKAFPLTKKAVERLR